MNPGAFYGKKTLRTRLPPEDKSDDSCLSDSETIQTTTHPRKIATQWLRRLRASQLPNNLLSGQKRIVKKSTRFHRGMVLCLKVRAFEPRLNISRSSLMMRFSITSLSRVTSLPSRKILTNHWV
ncbi:unnamed protein product [Ixodes hexagonus]